jgi:hypothetical protein
MKRLRLPRPPTFFLEVTTAEAAHFLPRSEATKQSLHPNPPPLAGEGREGATGLLRFARNDERLDRPKSIMLYPA